jgi:hypothetical protein
MSIAPHPAPENLAELLHSTAIRLLRAVRRVDESSGLTAPRLSALSVIVFNGAITLGKLAEVESFESLRLPRAGECLSEVALAGSKFLLSRYGNWKKVNRRTCLLLWSRYKS